MPDGRRREIEKNSFASRTCAHLPAASNCRASVRRPTEASASTALALGGGGGLCWGGIVWSFLVERKSEIDRRVRERQNPLTPLCRSTTKKEVGRAFRGRFSSVSRSSCCVLPPRTFPSSQHGPRRLRRWRRWRPGAKPQRRRRRRNNNAIFFLLLSTKGSSARSRVLFRAYDSETGDEEKSSIPSRLDRKRKPGWNDGWELRQRVVDGKTGSIDVRPRFRRRRRHRRRRGKGKKKTHL